MEAPWLRRQLPSLPSPKFGDGPSDGMNRRFAKKAVWFRLPPRWVYFYSVEESAPPVFTNKLHIDLDGVLPGKQRASFIP